MASLLLLISLLLLMFPRVLASLLLLAFPANPVVSCAAVGLAVDMFLLLLILFRPWSPCYAAFLTAVEVSSPGGLCYCWRPFCCLRPSVVAVGLPPGIASLLLLPPCYCWLPCCCVYVQLLIILLLVSLCFCFSFEQI